MPSVNLEYPKQPYSKVNRYDARASYSLETIHQIVNTCPILHVSFADPDSPFPATLPMIGQMGSFARPSADTGDVLDLYLHGYVSSRIMNMSRKRSSKPEAPSSSSSSSSPSATTPSTAAAAKDRQEKGEEEGLPITISATHVDGLVLSLTPNSHSYNYRSAVLFGRATPVADAAEKLYAMELITDSVVRDRYRHTRVPPSGAEMASTAVLRVAIAGGSAKTRSGMPGDERADLADAAVTGRVWTGVVPVRYSLERPVAAPGNRVEEVPAYLEGFREAFNRDAVEGAVGAATAKMAGGGKKGEGEGDD